MHPFPNIHRRFYALYSRIHMALTDLSPTKLDSIHIKRMS